MCQEETFPSARIQRPGDSEAEIAAPIAGSARDAVRRAEGVRSAPGPAADDTELTIATLDPGRAIRRCILVVAVGAILSPLEHVADHVVEPEMARSKGAERRRLLGRRRRSPGAFE